MTQEDTTAFWNDVAGRSILAGTPAAQTANPTPFRALPPYNKGWKWVLIKPVVFTCAYDWPYAVEAIKRVRKLMEIEHARWATRLAEEEAGTAKGEFTAFGICRVLMVDDRCIYIDDGKKPLYKGMDSVLAMYGLEAKTYAEDPAVWSKAIAKLSEEGLPEANKYLDIFFTTFDRSNGLRGKDAILGECVAFDYAFNRIDKFDILCEDFPPEIYQSVPLERQFVLKFDSDTLIHTLRPFVHAVKYTEDAVYSVAKQVGFGGGCGAAYAFSRRLGRKFKDLVPRIPDAFYAAVDGHEDLAITRLAENAGRVHEIRGAGRIISNDFGYFPATSAEDWAKGMENDAAYKLIPFFLKNHGFAFVAQDNDGVFKDTKRAIQLRMMNIADIMERDGDKGDY